jgi:hypothetical protein
MDRISIRALVRAINQPEGDGGGLWLPNIQRPFVWSQDQIARLFDSIMRGYPINTVMFWKTTSAIAHRSFAITWKSEMDLSPLRHTGNGLRKYFVLDGQQRIQAFAIALRGTYDNAHFCFDVSSDPTQTPEEEEMKFRFAFKEDYAWPWIRVSEISSWNTPSKRKGGLQQYSPSETSPDELDRMAENVHLLFERLGDDAVVRVMELDSTDTDAAIQYSEDDVLEIFIRANSGGTTLAKSDLLFSLLTSKWDEAEILIDELLDSVNAGTYNFSRDFVLKLALVLLGEKAAYKVQKFRKPGVREQMEDAWPRIVTAFQVVRDFVQQHTYMRDDSSLPSNLLLIPFIFQRFEFPRAWETMTADPIASREFALFLSRASLAGTFAGAKDNLIDALVDEIRSKEGVFDAPSLERVISANGQSVLAKEARLLRANYGTPLINVVLSMLYPDPTNYSPAYSGHLPTVDHIFPQALLKKVKTDKKARYSKADRNVLANCMLLTASENQSKGAELPSEYLARQSDEFLQRHLIPANRKLWEMEQYDRFVEARWKLIKNQMAKANLLELD